MFRIFEILYFPKYIWRLLSILLSKEYQDVAVNVYVNTELADHEHSIAYTLYNRME
jgi:hypothetical protein